MKINIHNQQCITIVRGKKTSWVFIVAIVVAVGIILSCQTKEKYKDVFKDDEQKTEQKKTTKNQYEDIDTTNAVTVTIDGYDPDADITVERINIWSNYENRSPAGFVFHGEKVKMLKRDGDAVLIRTSYGATGWVTYWFIKELK